jgi:uncharacterized protein (DUF488 family)
LNIYTLGYTGLTPKELSRAARQQNFMVLDIRFSPRSRNFVWNKRFLKQELGDHYEHIQELGNVNYKNGGDILIMNPSAGVARVAGYLAKQDVCVMCVCKDVHTCHRQTVSQLIHATTGFSVTHLTLDQIKKWGVEVYQLRLF